ncbi:hypothetical protein C823_002632 [Eubacterium plexicaudatum ASF492]|nr:hypothetical protein C823_002632 [Eubacterium plexicaudatum ASF492]
MGSCAGMVTIFVVFTLGFVLDSKMTRMQDDARYIGNLIERRIEQESLDEVISYAENFMEEENDICIVDENNRIVRHFGKGLPDFEKVETVILFRSYQIIPDMEPGLLEGDQTFFISFHELLKRSLEALEKSSYEDKRWLEQPLFYACYWTEIPVRVSGYRFYFRDSVQILQKNVFYMNAVILAELLLLGIPTLLLFINVISSIRMQKRMVYLLQEDPVTGGKNWNYFLEHSKKILRQVRNTRYTYAVVNLHMIRYQDYCACYGNKESETLLKK